MASLLNNASLLLNPAGSTIAYQEDKIYSVLPKDGTGDFTFTGGNGGTRVNQDGYIEQTPFNLFQYSNAFNTSPWAMAVTGGQTGKDGAANAWLLTKASPTTSDLYNALTVDGVQTFSIYVKKESSKGIKIYNFGTATQFVTINIGTGANVGQSGAGVISYKAVVYNENWWRVQVTMNCTNGKWYIYVTDGTLNQIQSSITIQEAQLAVGSDPKSYQPTTDRLNYPRITYQNGRGALLSELQRTNQLLYSNKFDESVWGGPGISVTASAATSPDSTNNAWKLVPSTISDRHYILQDSNVTSGTRYIQTIFAKAAGYEWLQFAPSTGFDTSYVNFNLVTGTIGTNTSGFIATITPFKDGWYRCSLASTANSTGAGSRIVIAPIQSDSQGRLPAWAGDGTSGIYIYGAQLESGGHPTLVVNTNFPTSYIPTTTATVSRPGDIAIDSSVSSLVSQNDGTLYISGVPLDQSQEFIALTPSGYNTQNIVLCYFNVGTTLSVRCYASSSLITNGTLNIPLGSYFKAAIRYKNGDSAVYINGQQRTTNSTAFSFTSTLNRINIQSNAYYFTSPGSHGLSTVATYTTGLTNTQLAELTTIRSGSGGNISYYGPYTIHTFTNSGTFTPSFNGEVEVLVVAGGGGGESHNAGGGGAGGVIYLSSAGVSAGTGYTITIGAGGLGSLDNGGSVIVQATNGSNSSAFGLEAVGGGAGGTWSPVANGRIGSNGGSGGGGGAFSSDTQPGGLGIPGQGNNGGNGSTDAQGRAGGGGGGAGEAGGNAVASNQAGDGGNGLPYSISGFSQYYGGGGGGAPRSSTNPANFGNGGLGGGGSYRSGSMNSIIGVDGTGGGGSGMEGANFDHPRPNGGSGIVIVRYLT